MTLVDISVGMHLKALCRFLLLVTIVASCKIEPVTINELIWKETAVY